MINNTSKMAHISKKNKKIKNKKNSEEDQKDTSVL